MIHEHSRTAEDGSRFGRGIELAPDGKGLDADALRMIPHHRGKTFKIDILHVYCRLLQAQIVPNALNTVDGARSRLT
jgi:hypothetical protein